jgi:hypothetical protein
MPLGQPPHIANMTASDVNFYDMLPDQLPHIANMTASDVNFL